GNRIDCDIQHRYQEQCSHQRHDDMPQYIEVGRVFAPDERGECGISHYIKHYYGQCGDGAEETEDLVCSEDDADEEETPNLEELLCVNRNIGCLVYRMDLSKSRWERSCLCHRIHYASSSVGTGDAYRQRAVDDGKEDKHPAYTPELLCQGVIGIRAGSC